MAGAAFDWLKSSFVVQQAPGAVLDGATGRLGAGEQELLWPWVGKGPLMKTQVFTLSPLGMIGCGQVGQEAGKFYVLPGWVGRQSEFAPNPLPGCRPLAPRAQGEELPMH